MNKLVNNNLISIVFKFLVLIISMLFVQCSKNSDVAGGAETTNTIASCRVVYDSGEPAIAASVMIRPIDYTSPLDGEDFDDISIQNIETDEDGYLQIEDMPEGQYYLEANDNSGFASLLLFEIGENTKDTILDDQILRSYTKVSGNVEFKLSSFTDIFVQIYGLNRIVEVDSLGYFEFNDLPEAVYTLVVASSVDSSNVEIPSVNTASNVDVGLAISNDGWYYQKNILIDASASGADIDEDVYSFPILVRLDSANFDFSSSDGNGQDIRISKEDGKLLPYEIEQWDSLAQSAILWVQVDTVFGLDTTVLNISWGDVSDVAQLNSMNVFSSTIGYSGVWHLNDSTQILNSTDTTIDGENFGTGNIDGVVSGAFNFNMRSYVMLPGESFSKVDLEVTVSFWQYGKDVADSGGMTIFDGRVSDTSTNHQLLVHLPWQQGDGDFAVFWDAGEFAQDSNRISKVATSDEYEGRWNYWSFTKNSISGEMKIYLNGELWHLEIDKFSSMSGISVFKLGSLEDTFSTINYNGYVDEFRVSHIERNEAWIKLCFENQREDFKIVTIESNP